MVTDDDIKAFYKAQHQHFYQLLADEQGDLYKILNLEDKELGGFAKLINAVPVKMIRLGKGTLINYDPDIQDMLNAFLHILKRKYPNSPAISAIDGILKRYQNPGLEPATPETGTPLIPPRPTVAPLSNVPAIPEISTVKPPKFDTENIKKLHKDIFALVTQEKGDLFHIINLDDKELGQYAAAITAFIGKWGGLARGISTYDPMVHQGLNALNQYLIHKMPSSASIPALGALLSEYNRLAKVLEARKPDRVRLAGIITNPETEMFMDENNRQASLVSRETYFKLRQIQMSLFKVDSQKNKVQNTPIQSRFIGITDPLYTQLNLKYPIFFGEKGEIIALMQATNNDSRYQLGRGASGSVFLGMDIETGKQVAIKVQNPSNRYSSQSMIDNEIANLSELNRLVATVADNKGNVYIVDEYVFGGTMFSAVLDISSGKVVADPIMQAEMAISLLEEMQDLHDFGLLHRDFRLDNIMWDPVTKTATMIDTGLSAKYDATGKFKGPHHVGNPDYTAPETFNGDFSIRSDTFAAGIALAALFRGAIITKSNDEEILNHISPKILQMLSMEPEKRPEIKEVMKDLQKYKNKLEANEFKKSRRDVKAQPQAIVITKEMVNNSKIKNKLYELFIANKTKETSKYNKESLFLLLLAAVKDQNINAFIAINQHYGLFDKNHQGYAQVIQKNVQASNNQDLQKTYHDLAAGKVPEVRKPAVLHSHKSDTTSYQTVASDIETKKRSGHSNKQK